MKKEYINPSIEVCDLGFQNILDISVDKDGTDTDDSEKSKNRYVDFASDNDWEF